MVCLIACRIYLDRGDVLLWACHARWNELVGLQNTDCPDYLLSGADITYLLRANGEFLWTRNSDSMMSTYFVFFIFIS